MELFNLIHGCVRQGCVEEGGLEAHTEQIDDKVRVSCHRCGTKANYPEEFLHRTTPDLINEALRGRFEVAERYLME